MPTECSPDKIRNPVTGRCVLRSGAIGKKLIQNNKAKKTEPHHDVKNTNKIGIFLLGLCDFSDIEVENLKINFNKKTKIKISKIFINHDICDMLKNIGKTFCKIVPKNNPYITGIYDYIKDLLDKNKEVYVFGHSYGGSVATRLAELFNNTVGVNIKNLHIGTAGSIYISKEKHTSNIDLKHYYYKGDVAQKCVNIDFENNKDPRIIISKLFTPEKTSKFKFWGSKQQWDIHNQYGEIIYDFYK